MLKAILIPTYSKNERYIDPCVEVLDALWPKHPQTWVLSDTGDFEYVGRVITDSPSWAGVVRGGLKYFSLTNHHADTFGGSAGGIDIFLVNGNDPNYLRWIKAMLRRFARSSG